LEGKDKNKNGDQGIKLSDEVVCGQREKLEGQKIWEKREGRFFGQ